MRISLLCNAGIALSFEGKTLLVDVLNEEIEPFCRLNDGIWKNILCHEQPFGDICGLYFTHEHMDHYSKDRTAAYLERWPKTPVFLPSSDIQAGIITIGPFTIEYRQLDHAPMDVPTPPHVVSLISAGEQSVYIAADAKLDAEAHRAFLKDRQADVAFWNSMYLSQAQTRYLMKDAAKRNFIYHMPEQRPDSFGLWKKCERNFQRYGDDLKAVTVIERYPYQIQEEAIER